MPDSRIAEPLAESLFWLPTLPSRFPHLDQSHYLLKSSRLLAPSGSQWASLVLHHAQAFSSPGKLQQKTPGNYLDVFLSSYFPSKPHFQSLRLPIKDPDISSKFCNSPRPETRAIGP